MSAITEYLNTRLTATTGDVHTQWAQLESLYEQRLWHQLTEFVQEFVKSDAFAQGGLLEFCSKFLQSLFDRLNPLSYTQVALLAVSEITSAEETEAYLQAVQKRVEKDTLANICALTALAEYYVALGDLNTAKTTLDSARTLVEQLDGVSPMHANFYRVSAEWNKRKGKFAEFYTDALRFLGCKDISELSADDAVQRAFDLGLAALLGEKIYNFGELLAHPILQSLADTDKAWLVDLLFAFNSGDLSKFEAMKGVWQSQADLAGSSDALYQKIRLLSLMELVFSSPPHERSLSFEMIATRAQMPMEQVEFLLIKALASGLVKGSIDQVAKVANLNWVQPRVLNVHQASIMRDRMVAWTTSVSETAVAVQTRTPEIFNSH